VDAGLLSVGDAAPGQRVSPGGPKLLKPPGRPPSVFRRTRRLFSEGIPLPEGGGARREDPCACDSPPRDSPREDPGKGKSGSEVLALDQAVAGGLSRGRQRCSAQTPVSLSPCRPAT
jgi:hypothetical protein